jgi:putative transposase
MTQQKNKNPRRHNSLRHPEIDYSDSGAYFVTTCTKNHESLFGFIKNGQMHCNQFGLIVWEVWKSLPIRYEQVTLDAAIVMPDHFHGIILIHDPINPNIRPEREEISNLSASKDCNVGEILNTSDWMNSPVGEVHPSTAR